jgi:uncharacterized protein
MSSIIGREPEKEILNKLLKSRTAELLAVYGRRRVGKTFLISAYLKPYMAFELTGSYQSPLAEQLAAFGLALQEATGSPLKVKPPDSWPEAFAVLQTVLGSLNPKKKRVIFLDEFPWLDGRRSGFLSAFDHFWNAWASRQSDLLVVICGSAASWMLRNIINSKGGLHHRITQKMPLQPFSLLETEQYLKSLGSKLDRYQILQLYMVFGGIPPYLKTVGKDKSALQAIGTTCFSKTGLLQGEFENLYHALFEMADSHIRVVRALAKKGKGLTRQQIIDACGLSSGGRATLVLDELEKSGFIQATIPYDKAANNTVYRLIDEFSIFYLRFMEKNKQLGAHAWERLSAEPAYAIWCGIAFEAVCLKHIEQIREALKIKVPAQASVWRYQSAKGTADKGAQIDLIIDRKDRIINLCEMKFYNGPFIIDKSYAKTLQQKMDVFTRQIRPDKTLFLTLITTFGIKENNYSDQLIQQSLTLDALFRF